MSKAEEILYSHLSIRPTEKASLLQAMKEIAELAWDAGVEYEHNRLLSDFINDEPNKEQFIQQTFGE